MKKSRHVKKPKHLKQHGEEPRQPIKNVKKLRKSLITLEKMPKHLAKES
jgi:hypothetical protein